jgi:hypothetical protein
MGCQDQVRETSFPRPSSSCFKGIDDCTFTSCAHVPMLTWLFHAEQVQHVSIFLSTIHASLVHALDNDVIKTRSA